MNILKNYYEIIIKYDLINKFCYSDIQKIPKLQKIVLNFGFQSYKIKDLTPALLCLELLGTKSGHLTKTKKTNLILKIKKGQPIGCCLTLTGDKMYNFLLNIVIKIFPIIKNFKGISLKLKNHQINSLSFFITDLTVFKELNTHFYFYNNLPPLSVTIVTNTTNQKEFIYLLNSFKVPIVLIK